MPLTVHPSRDGGLGGVGCAIVPVDVFGAGPVFDARTAHTPGQVAALRIGVTEELLALHLLAVEARNLRKIVTPGELRNAPQCTLTICRREHRAFHVPWMLRGPRREPDTSERG